VPGLANANARAKVIAALRRAGFVDEPGGKHTIVSHPDGRYTVIPNSSHLNKYTLETIIKQCGLTKTEYLSLYRGRRP